MHFVDLFCGLGGFHEALADAGECVFACEIDDELRRLYIDNYEISPERVRGDIRVCKHDVPPHDVLCAGFPCQPFSKSGAQRGLLDKTRGTLFHEILEVVQLRKPRLVLLENVGNFERHDSGRTWKIVKESLGGLGYHVVGTEHVTSGGHGLISPHHLGFPHARERFFIVASLAPIDFDPFPPRNRSRVTALSEIVLADSDLTAQDREETQLSEGHVRAIEHWNEFLRRIPKRHSLPSFPIWGEEFRARYPFEDLHPARMSAEELRRMLGLEFAHFLTKRELILMFPSYARTRSAFPGWKRNFIRQNREWFKTVSRFIPKSWLDTLDTLPSSHRKLEWHDIGEQRDLWKHVLQFRPSGLRVKRYTSVPALIAMTTSQVPILGPKARFIARREGLRLQALSDTLRLPKDRGAAFKALGNAVHAGVVRAIANRIGLSESQQKRAA